MELPDAIKGIRVETMTCKQCAHQGRSLAPGEIYCKLRTDLLPEDTKACGKFEYLPPVEKENG